MKRAAAALALAAISTGSVAAAQTLPVARTAVTLAAEGRSDSARALLNLELRRHRAGSAEYVEALFWRGRLAATGDSAERDMRRVAIEFSQSPWADDALLQLAQLQYADGNAPSAFELARRVRTDYPDSDLKPAAALWAGRAAFVTGEARTACALLDSALAESAANIEFANQVRFYRSRCDAIARAPQPAAGAGADSAAPAAAFEVQAYASREEAAARATAERLTRAGQRARVLAVDGGLYRVRIGPYATREQADAAAETARRLLGGRPFVVTLPR